MSAQQRLSASAWASSSCGLDAKPRSGFAAAGDRKSTRLNSSHSQISYAVFCLKKKIIPLHPRHIQISYGVSPLTHKGPVLAWACSLAASPCSRDDTADHPCYLASWCDRTFSLP